MSRNHDQRDLLKREGFTYQGMDGKTHQVWSDGVIEIRCPSSPSDYRTLANIRAEIRRLRRRTG